MNFVVTEITGKERHYGDTAKHRHDEDGSLRVIWTDENGNQRTRFYSAAGWISFEFMPDNAATPRGTGGGVGEHFANQQF